MASGVSELALWARGYGSARRRGFARLEAIFNDFPARLETDMAGLAAEIDTSLILASADPDIDIGPLENPWKN